MKRGPLLYRNHVCPVPECGEPCPQFMCPSCWPCVSSFNRRELFAELKRLALGRSKKPTPLLQELFNRALKEVREARGEEFARKSLPKLSA